MKKEKYQQKSHNMKNAIFLFSSFSMCVKDHSRFLLWFVFCVSFSVVGNVYSAEQMPANPEFYLNKSDGSSIALNGKNYRIKNTPTHRGLFSQDPKNPKNWIPQGTHYNYTSGVITSETPYLDGKKHGIVRIYYNGKLRTETEYVGGLKNGVHTRFWDNGLVALTEIYQNNSRHGLSVLMQEVKGKSVKLFETDYVDGKRHGIHCQYDSSGETVIETKVYDNDKVVSQK